MYNINIKKNIQLNKKYTKFQHTVEKIRHYKHAICQIFIELKRYF